MKVYSKIVILLLLIPVFVFGQSGSKSDSISSGTKAITFNNPGDTIFTPDSTNQVGTNPLEIGINRGIFITTPDQKMQMRIMGSVRMYTWYDTKMMNSPSTFNTYDIPIDSNNQVIPNFYFSVNQSRFGFEVTRNTNVGQIFVRLEMDFLGTNNSLRIRQAYGQFRNFLIGQTWSLFMDVNTQLLMVDRYGPTGNINIRTPQVRYSNKISQTISYDVALEYSEPSYSTPDSIQATTVMGFPSLSGRLNYITEKTKLQFSSILSRLTIAYDQGNYQSLNSYGFLLSGKFLLSKERKNSLYFLGVYTKSLSHFISTFINAGLDAVYDPNDQQFSSLNTLSGYVAYGRMLPWRVETTVSFGYAQVFNKSYQPENAFRQSFNTAIDAFWNIYAGTRLGAEYVYGQRYDKNSQTGQAGRVSLLFYYDF